MYIVYFSSFWGETSLPSFSTFSTYLFLFSIIVLDYAFLLFNGVARIFRTERPTYHALPAEVRGAGAARMGTQLKILKRFKLLENESIFKNFNIFLAPKNPFSKKNWAYISEFVSKFIFEISYFQFYRNYLINLEEFLINAIIHLRNLSKKLNKIGLYHEEVLEKDRNLWKYWR